MEVTAAMAAGFKKGSPKASLWKLPFTYFIGFNVTDL